MAINSLRKKEIIEECITKRCRCSWNDISLTSFRTVSLTDCKKEFGRLRDNGVISDEEYNAIFSETVVRELRPYKGKVQGLDDSEEGIVSKDYFSDMVSYICKIRLRSASTSRAWENARKTVAKLGLATDDMEEFSIPATTLLINNFENIAKSCGENSYPFIKRTSIYMSDDETSDPDITCDAVVGWSQNKSDSKTIETSLKSIVNESEFYQIRDKNELFVSYLSQDDIYEMAYKNGWDDEINLSKEPVQNPRVITIDVAEYMSDDCSEYDMSCYA